MNEFEKIKDSVIQLLETNLPKNLFYHNTAHTLRVLEHSIVIANYEKIPKHDLFLLKVAALFHDTGFISTYLEHETISCEIAENELNNCNFSYQDILIVKGLIMATKLPQSPKTKLEMILADADLEYLGTDLFSEIGVSLYRELKERNDRLTLDEWNTIQIKFLSNHSYFTTYCKLYREEVKAKNLKILREKTL